MKVVGTIRRIESYIFAISTGYTHSRIDIYSQYSSSEDVTVLLQMQYLNSKKVDEYNSYLLGSAMITASGTIKRYAGNLSIISTVLNMLENTGKLIDITSGALEPGEYPFENYTLTISSTNPYIASAQALKGLTYEYVVLHDSFRSVAAGARRADVKTFAEVIKNHDMSWYYDAQGKCKKDYRLIQSIDELYPLIFEMQKATYIALDTETTGTDFYWHGGDKSKRSKICGVSLSWKKDQGIYIPFMSNIFRFLDINEVMAILLPVLKSKQIVAHNGMFDFQVFYSYGFYIPISQDTLLMEFNIDPSVKRGSKGLKLLTRKYLNHETIELEELTGGRVIPELIPDVEAELIKVYACSDTDYTLQIFNLLFPVVGERPSYKLDCKLIDILAIAEYQGSPVDMQLLETMAKVNMKNLEIVESLMHKYLKTIGTQTLALRAFHALKGEDYTPSLAEIKELCEYQPFLDSIKRAFYKQSTNSKFTDVPLQFSASGDIAYILYDLLGYPVLKTNKEGSRTSDKEALDRLLNVPAVEPVKFLKEDIVTSAREFGVASDEVLVSKSKFESYQYPFAYLLIVWRKLQKFATSFFAPLQAGSSDGYFYSDNSMTSAETARVTNKIQTLEGTLKELIVPRDDEWYMIVFDKSQIEFRVMLGLAANYWHGLIESGALTGMAEKEARTKELFSLIENLNDWEKDYHREGGAIFAGCTPDTMTKEQRKKVKAIHFSVPYGAEATSVAKPKLIGVPEYKHAAIIAETEADLAAWRNKLYPLYYFLEHVRDVALTPLKVNPPAHEGVYGKVSNALGRYRLFNLSNITFKEQSAIRRQAGNYPIQSLARDIFFTGVLKLYNRLREEGIICDKFEDSKAVLNLFVHDEVVIQVHKSIHPYRMYKYIMETNLTKLKGHPTYFMGIAIANNWGQGKSDRYEAPIAYVRDCIAEYERNQEYYDNIATRTNLRTVDYCSAALDGITAWFAKRTDKELKKILGDTDIINPSLIDKKLINYYVKPRLPYYSKPCRKQEYLIDPSISQSANKQIKYIDYYLLVTGDYKNYRLLFNGELIPYADVLDFETAKAVDSETIEMTDSDFDLDLLDLSDADEDYAEKEAAFANEYYLLADPDIALNQNIYELADTDLEEDNDESDVPSLWSEDRSGGVVFFVNGMTPEQFKRLTVFLMQYKSVEGRRLFFFNGHSVDSGVSIKIGFTQQQVYDAVFGQVEKTVVFGG